MKWYSFSFLVAVLFNACGGDSNPMPEIPEVSVETESEKIVVGYVNYWNADKWGANFERAKQLTHINYAFANIAEGKVVEGQETDNENLHQLNQLKKVNPKLKILISVGGWAWSDHFSDAALTKQSREVFANSAVAFMLKHRIDGIDLDWEYPGLAGEGNVHRPEDKENFTLMLKRIREKLDSVGGSNQSYLLTIATGAFQSYLDHTHMAEAQKYLDFINIMSYDYFTGGSKMAGHHANLFASKQAPNYANNTANAVDIHLNAGIPKNKLVMGVPFYGRYWKQTNHVNNGIYQESSGQRGSLSFAAIADSISAGKFVAYWDTEAKAPYVWRESDGLFLTYENERSLIEKLNYIKDKELKGVMFWQFNADNGTLLKTIHENLN